MIQTSCCSRATYGASQQPFRISNSFQRPARLPFIVKAIQILTYIGIESEGRDLPGITAMLAIVIVGREKSSPMDLPTVSIASRRDDIIVLFIGRGQVQLLQ